MEPVWAHAHRLLDYRNEPFNNSQDLQRWQQLGYTQTRFTGDLYDMRQAEPPWMAAVREQLPMKHFSWSVYRMMPGTVLPNHSDTYAKFREIYSIRDSDSIRRYVIFMEPWQSGHYLEVDGTPVVSWQAGDGVYWHDDVPHVAANMGHTPRYTLQITGIGNRTGA